MAVKSTRTESLAAAVAALRRGEVIVYPTETLYGLGADALDCAAVDRVLDLKGRQPNNPISVLVAHQQMLRGLVADIPLNAQKLIHSFWPGPLTLVLPARNSLPAPLLNATGGIAVRISSQRLATRLVQAFGRPITATSANPSGQEPARTVEQAQIYFAARVRVFVDGGELHSKVGSTVIETAGDKARIIREGDISAAQIKRATGVSAA
jgi:L-threonylcarbamoyladenylate synthase